MVRGHGESASEGPLGVLGGAGRFTIVGGFAPSKAPFAVVRGFALCSFPTLVEGFSRIAIPLEESCWAMLLVGGCAGGASAFSSPRAVEAILEAWEDTC